MIVLPPAKMHTEEKPFVSFSAGGRNSANFALPYKPDLIISSGDQTILKQVIRVTDLLLLFIRK